jgi:uncharacterized protein (DUF433 family)
MATVSHSAQIATEPSIHAGEPIIEGTSTPVRAVAELWNQGMAAEEVPLHLPHLTLAQVFESLRYYLSHRQQIDGYIAANRIDEQQVGRQFDAATGRVR